MSQLTIEASLSSIAASLATIAQHLSTASPAAAAAGAPTQKASTGATEKPAKAPKVETPAEPVAEPVAEPAAAASDFDVKALQTKCMSLSAKSGAQALLEQFQKVGAGKWSEVKAEDYPTLDKNIDEALAAADAMG